MRNIIKITLLGGLLTLSACSKETKDPVAQFQSAMNAYQSEQFYAARDLLVPLSEDGHVDAQYLLAQIYLTGKLGADGAEDGLKWLDKAAESGHVKAMSMMGVQYFNGKNVEKDMEKAVKYLKTASENNNARAQLLMGFLHVHGEGVEKDENVASRYYFAAAQNGDEEAVQRIVALAENGGAEAVTYLGLMHKDGIGVETHAPKAAELVLKGAEQNFPLAQFMISHAYGAGQGFEQDYLKAHMWANLAAANGYEGAEKRRDTWSQVMTPEQIAEAQTMAREWTAKFEASQE